MGQLLPACELKRLAERVREQINAYPGLQLEAHVERFTGGSQDEVGEVLEAMLETGVVFRTQDERWF